MNAKQLFIKAHAMTKQIRKAGDNYRATFGLCLSYIRKMGEKMVELTLNQQDLIKRAKRFIEKKGFDDYMQRNGDVQALYFSTLFKHWRGNNTDDRFYFNDDSGIRKCIEISHTIEKGYSLAFLVDTKNRKAKAEGIQALKDALNTAKSDFINALNA